MPLSFSIFTFFNNISNYFYRKYLNELTERRKQYDKLGKSYKRVG